MWVLSMCQSVGPEEEQNKDPFFYSEQLNKVNRTSPMSVVRAWDSGFVVAGENVSLIHPLSKDLMEGQTNHEDKLSSEQRSPIKFQVLGLDMRCGNKTGDKPRI